MGLKFKDLYDIYIMSDKIETTNRKIIVDDYDENYETNSDIENNNNEFDEIEEYEYTQDTINIIQNTLIDYVTNNSLPLCEFLTINSVEKFLTTLN